MTEREDLDKVLDELEPDALRAIAFLADRLLLGQRCYGKIDLATDPRDWEKERRDEIGDLLVYSAFHELKRMTRGGVVVVPDPTVQQGRIEVRATSAFPREAPTQPEGRSIVPTSPTRDVRVRTGVVFVCSCEPRELRSDKGLRCANCNALVKLV